MDKTRILQQGEEAKFQIVIKDFDQETGSFDVTLIYGYSRKEVNIDKSKMFQGGDGKWYFTFNTGDMVGRVTARCTWRVPDADCSDGYREETDEQYLCFVATTPCPQFIACPACTDQGRVIYTRTEESDIAGLYAYLACADYDRILTCDNEVILVLKSTEGESDSNDNNQNE